MEASIVDFSEAGEVEGLKNELAKQGVDFEERSLVMASADGGSWPGLLIHASTFGPLAAALCAYFKHHKRRVSIKSLKTEVVFENYSVEEIEKILNTTNGMIQIGDRPRFKA
jgi:hypothetical protein